MNSLLPPSSDDVAPIAVGMSCTAPVRIGIDGRYQAGPLTGVPRYIDELCTQLDILLPDAHFILYAQRAEGIRLPSARWSLRIETSQRWARAKPNLWWKFRAGPLIRADKLDVLWAAAGLLPFRAGKAPTVLTVYDITFRLYPKTMSRSNLWAHRLFFRGDLLRASRVLAISEGTSRRLHELYGRGADAIVRPDAAAFFHPESDEKQADARARYGLRSPFLLAVSTLEPRKNFVSLIEAFLLLKRAGHLPEHELVLIGKKGWKDTALAGMIASDEGRSIRSLGFVPDPDLPALYSACDVFCMPSLYEGFGIPVLEARRCDAPVVTTDIPELREAGDELCVYVSPDAASIATGIKQVLEMPKKPLEKAVSDSSWSSQAMKMLPFLLNR